MFDAFIFNYFTNPKLYKLIIKYEYKRVTIQIKTISTICSILYRHNEITAIDSSLINNERFHLFLLFLMTYII